MTRALILAAVIISACSSPVVEVQEIAPAMSARIMRYAVTAYTNGTPPNVIVNRMVARTGEGRDEVIALLKTARGKHGRHEFSRRREKIGALTKATDAAVVNAAIADGLCFPLADEGDAADYADCLIREGNSLAEHFCRIANGADDARGARIMLTSWQSQRIRDNIQALSPMPTVDVVRNADDGTAYLDAATARGLKRCEEAIK